jgi:predicted DNA-binding transcriptional regulator AlpA
MGWSDMPFWRRRIVVELKAISSKNQAPSRKPHPPGSAATISSGTIPPVWQELETAAHTVPEEFLADFLASLEKVRVIAFARLVTPVLFDDRHDELIDIKEAARRLGVSSDFLYHNHTQFSFTRRVGRSLRFSSNGIETYIRSRR